MTAQSRLRRLSYLILLVMWCGCDSLVVTEDISSPLRSSSRNDQLTPQPAVKLRTDSPQLPLAPVPETRSPVTVLMYHDVSTGEASRYSIPIKLFSAQMRFLVDQGYQTITTSQYVDYLQNQGPLPAKPVMITFDDWEPGQYRFAFPLLKELGLTAVFFIPSQKLVSASEQEKVRELVLNGFEIGSHTVHHYYLTQENCNRKWKCCRSLQPCTNQQVHEEIMDSRIALEKITDLPVTAIAWPGNYFNDFTTSIATSSGYQAAFAVENQVVEDGGLTNRVGITTNQMNIYRTEIDGYCDMSLFPEAVTTQRCCVLSKSRFHRYCLPQER